MEIEEFGEAIRKDDFAIGDSFWIGDWEFEVVSRKMGDRLVGPDETVYRWKLTADNFLQAIRDNHPEIENPEEFFNTHRDDIIKHFEKGFDVLIGGSGATRGTVMNDAIDEVISHGQDEALMKTEKCVTIAGKPVIDIYEADNGRCWFVTKRVLKDGQQFLSGYVRCLRPSMLAEFHHLPEETLKDTVGHIWRVDKDAWHRCPCVDIQEDTEKPKIVHCDGRDTNARPSNSCSNTCKEVNEKMNEDMKAKVDGYLWLFEEIKNRSGSETVALALLQEVAKDKRTEGMREANNSQPATTKQKRFMDDLGINYPKTITKKEASMLIDEELGRNGQSSGRG